MLNRFLLLLALGVWCSGARAQVLPPEKLLPRETILVLTAPDSASAWSLMTNSPYGRLWQDPQMKPFKDKFIDKFTTNVVTPIERNLGINFSDYQGLARGQATFAILHINDSAHPDIRFGRVLLLDTKDRASQLSSNLAGIRQKWAAAGKPMKTDKIRDTDFTTLVLSDDDLSWDKILKSKSASAAPGADPVAISTNKSELIFGQAGSLLLVGDSKVALEKVLSRQEGGLVPALEEQPFFQTDFAARLRGAAFYAWVNVKDVIETTSKASADADDSGTSGAPKTSVTLEVTGANGLTSASIAYRSSPEGMQAQFFVGAPESKRRGLLKALAAEPKDANPTPFVPADVTKFLRWRLNIPHSWTQLETMLNELNPQYAKALDFLFQSAGKDKDEKYDLKSELLGNLGDDIIQYEKAPTGNTLPELNSPPSIFMLGSPNPEKLAAAVKNGLGSFMGPAKNREFLGRQISTLTFNVPGAPAASAKSFSLAGSGGYVAFSDNNAILEEYLRSDENKARPLSEMPGLADAAQKVGGMGTGLFMFENQNISMRSVLETLRLQPVSLQDILGSSSVMSSVNTSASDGVARLREWADFSLLPPYDGISQYFYFSVFAGAFSPDGFTLNYFSPTPPRLR